MKYIAIIPARYASTRFPGKPLAMLGGKAVIRRVYEQVSKQMDATWVATDDSRIYDHVVSWGGNAVMTSPDHKSGTDRIEEAMEKIEASGGTYDVVVNVQGDEPFIQPEQIEAVCKCFDDVQTQIATLGIRFASAEACGAETGQDEVWRRISNANSPKIVVDNKGFAMYFSRSVIPFVRGKECTEWGAAYPFMKHMACMPTAGTCSGDHVTAAVVTGTGRESGAAALVAERIQNQSGRDIHRNHRHRHA